MTITSNDILQHAPLVLYLLAVAALSINLFPSIRNFRSGLFTLCALGSLGVTWTFMFKYMYQSYQDHCAATGIFSSCSTTKWLEETSLFDEAWRYVCRTSVRWWISSQLCLFTVGVFTVFLYAEGSRHPELRGKAARFMILGQIVAISFASALFLASLANSSRSTSASTSSFLNWCIGLAFCTVLIVPYTVEDKTFLPNLLVMHVLITLPLLGLSASTNRNPSARVRVNGSFKRLYWAIAIVSAAMHAKHSIPALAASGYSLERFGEQFWETIYSYPAQSSISWDVICTNGIWQLWAFIEVWRMRNEHSLMESAKALLCIGLVPTVGSASGIAAFLAIREDWLAAEHVPNAGKRD